MIDSHIPKNLLESFNSFNAQDSYFISFEGIEGAGKTTQINEVKSFLENKGYTVSQFREPGGSNIGEKLRQSILESPEKLHPLTEAHIFCASRSELMAKSVIPLLEKPKNVVILDRFIDSSLAYQGMARGLGMQTILELHQHSPLNVMPHMTFYLDIDLATSMQRQKSRGNNKDYFEKENHDFYKKLIHGYEESAKLFPSRIKRVDASKPPSEVTKELLTLIEGLING